MSLEALFRRVFLKLFFPVVNSCRRYGGAITYRVRSHRSGFSRSLLGKRHVEGKTWLGSTIVISLFLLWSWWCGVCSFYAIPLLLSL